MFYQLYSLLNYLNYLKIFRIYFIFPEFNQSLHIVINQTIYSISEFFFNFNLNYKSKIKEVSYIYTVINFKNNNHIINTS